MMHGHEKSDLVIVAVKPTNISEESSLRRRLQGRSQRSRWSEGRGPRGIRTSKARTGLQNQARVSQALERIRQLVPSHTRGRSRMRESRTYGSGRGACHEMHVPTATCARQSWCDPAGGSPAQVRSSVRLVASVAWPLATVVAKRTQRLHGVWD